MKKTIRIHYDGHRTKQQQINYIPIRYIIAILLAVLETAAVIAIVMLLSYYVPYFYLAMWVTEIAAIIHIIASDGNADYKIPWLIVVMVIPVGGLMLFIMFGSRKLKKKYIRLENGDYFNICPENIALQFSFETYPGYALNKAKRLPMGCHDVFRYDPAFFYKFIMNMPVSNQENVANKDK
jgi:hypothetical protein